MARDLAQSIEVGEDEEPLGVLDLLDTMARAGLVFAPADWGRSDGDLVDHLVEVGGHRGVDRAVLARLLESAGVHLALGEGALGAYLAALFLY